MGTGESVRCPAAVVAFTANQTGSGNDLPRAVTGSPARYSMAERVLRYVSSPTTMPFTGACTCSRAAVLTTSPATMDSPYSGRAPSAARASPVLTAVRTCRSSSGSAAFRSATASRTASAARTARSGSSPYATGAPNTAITASPMNFSTTPPNRSISSLTRA